MEEKGGGGGSVGVGHLIVGMLRVPGRALYKVLVDEDSSTDETLRFRPRVGSAVPSRGEIGTRGGEHRQLEKSECGLETFLIAFLAMQVIRTMQDSGD